MAWIVAIAASAGAWWITAIVRRRHRAAQRRSRSFSRKELVRRGWIDR